MERDLFAEIGFEPTGATDTGSEPRDLFSEIGFDPADVAGQKPEQIASKPAPPQPAQAQELKPRQRGGPARRAAEPDLTPAAGRSGRVVEQADDGSMNPVDGIVDTVKKLPQTGAAAMKQLGTVGAKMNAGISDIADAITYPIDAAAATIINSPLGQSLGLPSFDPDKMREDSRRYWQSGVANAVDDYVESKPEYTGPIQKGVLEALESLPTSLAAAAAGVASRNPNVALSVMGMTTGLPAYSDARAEGKGHAEAFQYAFEQGGTEVLTEKIPASSLVTDVLGKSPFGKTLLKQLAEEIPGEQVATLLQDLSDWAHFDANKGKTFKDYLDERPSAAGHTLLATISATTAQTGAIVGADRALDAAGRLSQRRAGDNRQAPAGVRETAEAQAATITPEDEASPLDTADIVKGRVELAKATAGRSANAGLEANAMPKVGKRVTVTMPDGTTQSGTMADWFEADDGNGVVVDLDNGKKLREYTDTLADAGVSITEHNDALLRDSQVVVTPSEDREPEKEQAKPGKPAPVADGGAIISQVFGNRARITSTYRDANHPLSKANPNSYHTKTHAAVDIAPIEGMTFEEAKAAIEAQGYTLIEALNETGKGRTAHATGDHWHFVIGEGGANVAASGTTQGSTIEYAQPDFSGINPAEKVDIAETQPVAADMDGGKVDEEWNRFAPETGTLDVPRAEMPQIKAEHRGAMVNFLNARGIQHNELTVPARSLKPTQAEFSPAKVQKAMDYEGGNRAILVSNDGHVLDGHHQWLASRDLNLPIRAIELDAPIKDLLAVVPEFPSAETSDGATTAPAKPQGTADVERPNMIVGDKLAGGASLEEAAKIAGQQATQARVVDNATGKSVAIIGASQEQLAAIRSAIPKAQPIKRKDGAIVYSKKYADQIRDVIAGTETSGADLQGEQINEDWTRFADDSGSLEIPRADMPQVKAEHRGAMVNFLNARGIAHQEETVPATSLKPTQAEFSPVKVQKAKSFKGGDRAILVSSDRHVVDGHHQWVAARDKGEDIRVIRLDKPVKELLDDVREFPSSETDDGATATVDKNGDNSGSVAQEAAQPNAKDGRVRQPDQDRPASTAPEHAIVGVDDAELSDIVVEFKDVLKSQGIGDNQVTHVFDPPKKSDIVRLADKVKVYNSRHGWMTPAQAQAKIREWEDHAVAQGQDPKIRGENGDKIVLSLFDLSGEWSLPWEQAGYDVWRFDIQDNPDMGDVHNFSTEFFADWFGDFDGRDVYAVLAACPCTDFASSGARHFAAKDADGRTVASVKLVQKTLATIEYFKPAVWAIENPVGRIEKLGGLPPWRLSFDPNHLGEDYTKKTLIWGRFNGDLPIAPTEPTAGSKMWSQYGGKSQATKNARSVTPEGFSYSFFMANNAHDHPAMALANKYDRLSRAGIERALDAGVTPEEINEAVEDLYYGEMDDDGANAAVKRLADKAKTRATLVAPVHESKPEQEKPASDASSQIEDFGEKLEGARKDQWQSFRDRIARAKEEDVTAVPLSKSWPEPDYQKLIDEGAAPYVVAAMRALRDAIPTKPRSYGVVAWSKQVEAVREMAERMLDDGAASERLIVKLTSEYQRSLSDLQGAIDLYLEFGHERSFKGISFGSHHYGLYRGEKNVTKWSVTKKQKATAFSNWPRELAVADTREEALAQFKALVASGGLDKKQSSVVRFDIYSRRGEPGFWIGKKIGKSYADLKHFETAKDARAYKVENYDDLVAALDRYKDIPSERKEINSPRIGINHRNGADVTPEQFSETFGFRGVQFGNYVEGARRQDDLNEAYDALMDLAGVLGLPAKALSLNGELGLAFGARGKGGKGAAKAHYEPNTVVINLTKKAGAGSLAHEWWHSLDNYFARQRGNGDFVTSTTGRPIGNMREEMANAFKGVMNSIRQTSLRERSRNLDKRRTKEYWSTDIEMSARSFESYVIAKLNDEQFSNDYLANIVSDEAFRIENGYPYPTAAEIPAIRAAFDNFFSTVETEETASGVRMFSQPEDNENQLDNELPVVAILSGKEFGKLLPKGKSRLDALRKRAISFFANKLTGRTVTASDGKPVMFGRRGMKKTTAFKGDEILRLVPAIEDIITKGRKLPMSERQLPNDISKAEMFAGIVKLDGKEIRAGVIVLTDTNGRRHYDLTNDVKDRTAGRPDRSGGASAKASVPVLDASPSGELNLLRLPDDSNPAAETTTDMARLEAELRKLGLSNKVILSVVDTLGGAQGDYLANRIRIAEDASTDQIFTLHHEVVHALRDMGVFNQSDWALLVAKAKRDPGLMRSIERRYAARFRKDGMSEAEARDALNEEAVADLFGKWQRGDYQAKGTIAKLFERLRGILQAIKSAFGNQRERSAEDVLGEIADGTLGGKAQAFTQGGRDGGQVRKTFGRKASASDTNGARARGIPTNAGLPLSVFTDSAELKAHQDYKAAKAGDAKAAARLVRDTVPQEMLRSARDKWPGATFLFPHAEESSGINAIPGLFAWHLAHYAGGDAAFIQQANRAHHTGARMAERLLVRPAFVGEIVTGNDYVLVDDVTTSGATLAEMANYVIANGGNVIGTSLLANASRTGVLTPSQSRISLIRSKYAGTLPNLIGVEPEALTRPEADYLAGFRNADALRATLTKAERERTARLRSRGIRQQPTPSAGLDPTTNIIDAIDQIEGDADIELEALEDNADAEEESRSWTNPEEARYSLPETEDMLSGEAFRRDRASEDAIADAFSGLSVALDGGNGAKERVGEALETVRIAFQDKMLPVLRLQEAVSRQVGSEIGESTNPYLAEETMHGRIGARLDALMEDHVAPLVEALAENDVELIDFEDYVYARHAPERNAQIAKINEDMPDGGSGMTDLEARAVMNRISEAGKTEIMERMAARLDAMLDEAVQRRIEGGLLSQDEADAWREVYEHYVPLRGRAEIDGAFDPKADARMQRSSGLSVKGKESKRAFGRRTKAADILSFSVLQAEEAIVRAEQNRVGQAFLELAKQVQDENILTIDKVERKRRINPSTGLVEFYTVNQITAEDAPYTVNTKVDGVEHRVTMNRANPKAVAIADAMRNLSAVRFELLVRTAGKLTRFFSAVNTRFSPPFIITNAIRDAMMAATTLQQYENMPGLSRDVLRDWRKALVAPRRGDSEWAKWRREWELAGGKVAFNQMVDFEGMRERLHKDIARARHPNDIKRVAGRFFEAVETVNDSVERAVRLSVYANARRRGASKAKAASMSLNVTVNFTRKGKYGSAMNSAYAFFNASTQGSATLIFAAARSKNVRRTMFGFVLLGFALDMLNSMISGDDDDGESYWDKLPEWEKSRNLILMLPGTDGKYIKLPVAYGINALYGIGRNASAVGRGAMKAGDAAMGSFLELADAFNPVGGGGTLWNIVAPTALDPFVDVSANKDFTGRPIQPEANPFGSPETPSNNYFPSVSTPAKWIAKTLNDLTGGDDVLSGAVSVSPEVLDYAFGYVTGGAGRFVEDNVNLVTAPFDPEAEVTINDIPMVDRLTGQYPQWLDKGLYYERAHKMRDDLNHIKEYVELGKVGAARAFVKERPWLAEMEPVYKAAEKEMRAIRKEKRAIYAAQERDKITDDQFRRGMDMVKAAEDNVVQAFNTGWNQAMKKADAQKETSDAE